ncbi:MAG: outer membrane protein assembly factor BamD [Candidatus Omnitrophica bacterium]|nr:outer membrane protein assembly factor BamD [Candidatus Omnitrophota bacterium]
MRPFLIGCLIAAFLLCSSPAFAYWIWSPETGKFVNPEGAVEDTAEEQYQYALTFVKDGNYDKATDELKNLIKKYPGARVAPEAQYKLGIVYEEKRDYYAAFQAYQKVIENYPQSDRINEVIERQFKIGNLYLSGRRDKVLGVAMMPALPRAAEIFKQISESAPFSGYGEKSLFNLAVAYKKQGLYEEAMTTLQKFIDNYPDSTLINDAKYQMAETTFERSQKVDRDQRALDDAQQRFEDFLKEYPDTTVTDKAKKLKLEIDEKNAEKNFKIGQYYEKDGYLDSALIYYQDVAENYPNTSWGKLAQERIGAVKEPGKFIKAKEEAIYDELAGIERERKAILGKGVTAKGEETVAAVDKKRTEIEARRRELEGELSNLKRKKEEGVERRWQAIKRKEEELKGNEKKLKEKMKALKNNPSEDLKRAFDRWSQSLEAEKIALDREKVDLRNLEKELGIADRGIMEKMLPFMAKEGDLAELYQFKAKEILQLETDFGRIKLRKEELTVAKRGLLERRAALDDEELALFREKETFEAKETGEKESLKKEELMANEEREKLLALIAKYEKKKTLYKSVKGSPFLGILQASSVAVAQSVDFILPIKIKGKTPEIELAALLEEREHLNTRIEDQRAIISSILRSFDEELEVSSVGAPSADTLVKEAPAIDSSDSAKVRKSIKAMQREIRKRYEEIEDRAKAKSRSVDELEEVLHGKKPSLAYQLSGPARLFQAFLFGLPDKEARVKEEAEDANIAKASADSNRAKALRDEIEMQNLLIQARYEEIQELEKTLEELEARIKKEGKTVKVRSLLIDKPILFVGDALRLASGIIPKKDEKELLVDRLDKHTRALHGLEARLVQLNDAIQNLEKSVEEEENGDKQALPQKADMKDEKKELPAQDSITGKSEEETPPAAGPKEIAEGKKEGAPSPGAVKETEAVEVVKPSKKRPDAKKLEKELSVLKERIELKKQLYESRKKVSESHKKRFTASKETKKLWREIERREKEIAKQKSFYAAEIRKLDERIAKTLELAVATLTEEIKLVKEKKDKLGGKLDEFDRRHDSRAAVLKEEMDRLSKYMREVEASRGALESEVRELGLNMKKGK